MSRNCLITVMFADQSRIQDRLYGTCFTSPFCHLEFRGGSQLSGKFVDPCFKEIWTSYMYREFLIRPGQWMSMKSYFKKTKTLSYDYYERLGLILMCTNNIRLRASDKTRLTFGNPLQCTHCCTAVCITIGFNVLIAESFWGLFCTAMRRFDAVLHTDSSAVNTDSILTYSKITYFKIHILFSSRTPFWLQACGLLRNNDARYQQTLLFAVEVYERQDEIINTQIGNWTPSFS
jgi:hypothetical protein